MTDEIPAVPVPGALEGAESEPPANRADMAALSKIGAKRSAERRRFLTLSDVEAELPPMSDPANVQRRVEVATAWACAALIPAGVAGAIVRSAEVWHKLEDLKDDRRHVADLEDEVARLNKALERMKSEREG